MNKKRPNFIDHLVYRLFFRRWNPIFRDNADLREIFFNNLKRFSETTDNTKK